PPSRSPLPPRGRRRSRPYARPERLRERARGDVPLPARSCSARRAVRAHLRGSRRAAMKISVLTPSIPERRRMLHECIQSVKYQTVDGASIEHRVWVDERRDGCSVTMNRLAKQATGDWLLPLADDDLLLPGAIFNLLA